MSEFPASQEVTVREVPHEVLVILCEAFFEATYTHFVCDDVDSRQLDGYKYREVEAPLSNDPQSKELFMHTDTPENNVQDQSTAQQMKDISQAQAVVAKEALSNRKGVWFTLGVLTGILTCGILASRANARVNIEKEVTAD